MSNPNTAEKVPSQTESTEGSSSIELARESVRKYTLYCTGVGLIPFPIIDFAALTALQVLMVKEICSAYPEINFKEHWGKTAITSLISSVAPGAMSSGAAASAIKAIPFIGGIIGAFTFPAFAGASTWALGQLFISHFESNGTLMDLDTSNIKDSFKKFYDEKISGNKSSSSESSENDNDLLQQQLDSKNDELQEMKLAIQQLEAEKEAAAKAK